MSETQLKPCPFCGKPPYVNHQDGYTIIECGNDECRVIVQAMCDDSAESNWNRRADSAELTQLRAELAEAKTEIQRLRGIAQHMDACRSLLSVEDNEVLYQAISAKIGELAEARKDSERLTALFTLFGGAMAVSPFFKIQDIMRRGRRGIDELVAANPSLAKGAGK